MRDFYCDSENLTFGMESNYAKADANRFGGNIKSERCIWMEFVVKLVDSEETIEDKSDKLMVYRIQSVITNKNEVISDDDVETCLISIIHLLAGKQVRYSGGEIRHQSRNCFTLHYYFT